MGKDNTLLYLAVGGVAAYLLLPPQIREKITPGGGGGGVTSFDFSNFLEGLGGGGTTIIDRVVETIREIPEKVQEVIEQVPDVFPDIGIPEVPGLDDIFSVITGKADELLTTTKEPPGPPKYNIGDYVGALWKGWEEFITGWQEPKEDKPDTKLSEYALSVLKRQLESEGQQRWDDMSLTQKVGFVFTGRWPEWTPKSEPAPYPDSFYKRPEPAPITEKAPGLTRGEAAVAEFYWAHALNPEPTPEPEPTPTPEPPPGPPPTTMPESSPWRYT